MSLFALVLLVAYLTRNTYCQSEYSNSFPTTSRSNRRAQAGCSEYEWKCDDGECTDSANLCDGTIHCSDGSDETSLNCFAMTCPRYAFKCLYGACVPGHAECNHQIDCVDGSDEATSKCPTKNKHKLHGSCAREKFQCDNGDCIDIADLCDGQSNCFDQSDELVKYCAAIDCQRFAFRCANGACISTKLKCDGHINCIDGSDENYLLCGRNRTETTVTGAVQPLSNTNRPTTTPSNWPARPTSITSTRPNRPAYTPSNITPVHSAHQTPQSTSNQEQQCRADNIPENGDAYYLIDGQKRRVLYGELIDSYVLINYTCIENHYVVEGNASNICLNGRWTSATPKCEPRCSSTEIQGITISANCFSSETQRSTSCVRPVTPGTRATITCRRGYEHDGTEQTLHCGLDGRWSPTPRRCSQICGEINEGTAYIVGGSTTNITNVPWHAAIYRRVREQDLYQQICGGTIISSKIIISAMHCFWDASENAPYPTAHFLVAVGKSIRTVDAREEHKPQFSTIQRIVHIDGYSDYMGYYADDIALVILDKFIEFHSYVVPICLPDNLKYEEKSVPAGWIGLTAGWGLEQSNGVPSNVLKKIELPVISREQCRQQSSPEFASYITSDKFCAGYLNGVSVCQGDSGGGLVFASGQQKRVYTLRGIVSTGGNKGGSCDSDKYTTFTNVAQFMDFVNAHRFNHEPKN